MESPTEKRIVRIVGLGPSREPDGRRPARPVYSAPEIGSGERFDGRADLYSLAAAARTLLRGRRRPASSSPLTALLQRMHDHDPEYRPENAFLAAAELGECGILERPPPEVDPAAYVTNTLFLAQERTVSRLVRELGDRDREIEVSAGEALRPVAEELRRRTELRRAP
ncbi:MAG: hypothetical protein GF355_16675, partial [Candidatus Eisenbacteria bacterium]|nr:hypothetical protein [Candidatus Eisenbacteria bacterium]